MWQKDAVWRPCCARWKLRRTLDPSESIVHAKHTLTHVTYTHMHIHCSNTHTHTHTHTHTLQYYDLPRSRVTVNMRRTLWLNLSCKYRNRKTPPLDSFNWQKLCDHTESQSHFWTFLQQIKCRSFPPGVLHGGEHPHSPTLVWCLNSDSSVLIQSFIFGSASLMTLSASWYRWECSRKVEEAEIWATQHSFHMLVSVPTSPQMFPISSNQRNPKVCWR